MVAATKKESVVYIGMTADIVHHGLINVINTGRRYGSVTVGLLTDKAVAEYKRIPHLNYDERKKILENIKGVDRVVPQEEWDYSMNLKKYRPDVMVHGNDWCQGPQQKYREKALAALKDIGGKLVEVEYTEGVSSSQMLSRRQDSATLPFSRLGLFRRILNSRDLVRLIEVHNAMSGLIVDQTKVQRDDRQVEFDAMWASSLTMSTVLGKPDIESVSIESRLSTINEIFDVTTKPLVFDADTGGKPEHLHLHIRSMERMGISAVIIEDKVGLKKNSLLGTEVKQTQDDIPSFSEKIMIAKKAQTTEDFMVIARIESLIMGKPISDALERAQAYLEAGADGIMIHSRSKEPDEILSFCKEYHKRGLTAPLVAVPSSYNRVHEKQLADHGVKVIIYANHLLRAAYPAMTSVAESILLHGRSYEAEDKCLPIRDILKLIPGTI